MASEETFTPEPYRPEVFEYDEKNNVTVVVGPRVATVYEGRAFRDSHKGASDRNGDSSRALKNFILWGAGADRAEPLSVEESRSIVRSWVDDNLV